MKNTEVFFGPNCWNYWVQVEFQFDPEKFEKTRGCMYGIFTYIYHRNQPNVGKYTIHGYMGPHIPIHSLPESHSLEFFESFELWEVYWVPMTDPWETWYLCLLIYHQNQVFIDP